MNITDLSRIDRVIDIEAPPERIWRALTDARELSAWFQVTIEGTIAPGSEVWMTSVHPDHHGERFRVRFTELDAPKRLVWEWHPGSIDPAIDYSREPRTTVTFDLETSASGRGTRLRVAETGFDAVSIARRAKVYEDNSGGWTTVLVWLKDHVEAAR